MRSPLSLCSPATYLGLTSLPGTAAAAVCGTISGSGMPSTNGTCLAGSPAGSVSRATLPECCLPLCPPSPSRSSSRSASLSTRGTPIAAWSRTHRHASSEHIHAPGIHGRRTAPCSPSAPTGSLAVSPQTCETWSGSALQHRKALVSQDTLRDNSVCSAPESKTGSRAQSMLGGTGLCGIRTPARSFARRSRRACAVSCAARASRGPLLAQ